MSAAENHVLEVKNLTKSFGKDEVLRGIDFSVNQGEVLSIIGSSGSGKTTLLRCLNALETADSGQILIHGEAVFDAAVQTKRSGEKSSAAKRTGVLPLGLVFQSFNLFPQYNVLDNVCLAVKLQAKKQPDFRKHKKEIFQKIEEDARKIIARVGLTAKEKNYPCELSGGQQQRVAIARALALNPEILCFDEPTSALDPELTGEVLSVIRDLAKENMTMIIVTHEMSFARDVSNKVIFMHEGVIAEEGAPEELFLNPKTERLRSFLNSVPG